MPAPSTIDAFLEVIHKSGVLDKQRLDTYLQRQRDASTLPRTPEKLAPQLVRDGLLTRFQAEHFLQGKWRGFLISGKYKLLEYLGAGGMGTVYLCEHNTMQRRVAIKVMPHDQADDPDMRERFYREARAVAALDHPNIVRAHDVDHDGKQHFLVMEYVDGSSLHHIVKKTGPMDFHRAAHYIFQAALGLQHAHEHGLVHRDVKPGNLLVDRTGTVKVLDLGLARFFHDTADNLTSRQEGVLGTVDYLAPEQAVHSHVDIRADIYSLGMTFYFLLAGSNPFHEGTTAQKLIWQQTRRPKPIRSVRPEVPEELAAILDRMIAKEPAERYQTPNEVADALAPWIDTPIPPPADEEMPHLCPAAAAGGVSEPSPGTPRTMSRKLAGSGRSPTAWVTPPLAPSPGGARAATLPVTDVPGNGTTPRPAERLQLIAPGNPTARPATKDDNTHRVVEVVVHEEEDEPRSDRRQSPSLRPRPGHKSATPDRRQRGKVVAWLAVALGLLAVGGGVTWWAMSGSSQTPADGKGSPGRSNADSALRPDHPASDVTVWWDTGSRRIKTPTYEATVQADGCLTSLKLGGQEWLWVGGVISRGSYVFQGGGALKLSDVKQPSARVVTARNDQASIRYEFGPDSLTWNVTNSTAAEMSFFIVLDSRVSAVMNATGEVAKTPAVRAWPTTTFFAGPSKVVITGGTNIWGPWEKTHQVWTATLKPQETRQVVLRVGTTTAAEAARVAAATGSQPAVPLDLTVKSPLNYQVFQRYSRLRGQIGLQGSVRLPCDKVEVRLSGTSLEGKLPDKWQDVLPFNPANRSFDTTIPISAGGWYKVELRALQNKRVVASATIDKVGVGEVFIGAGQSNSTNCGEERLKPKSGMVASFSGSNWQPADDPQPGVHDKTGNGSYWPAFGDVLYEKYRVPIGVASTGHSGSSVKEWQPGSEYFQWLMTRLKQLGSGGFRAVLWHQGETDVSMTADEYFRLMKNVIETSKKEARWEFPWFVARVSYLNPTQASFPATTRAAQQKLWQSKVALEGPDTDTLTGANRDAGGKGIHFSGQGLRAHGKMWADKVAVYLDGVLSR